MRLLLLLSIYFENARGLNTIGERKAIVLCIHRSCGLEKVFSATVRTKRCIYPFQFNLGPLIPKYFA